MFIFYGKEQAMSIVPFGGGGSLFKTGENSSLITKGK
jgi:hypothetical protein